MIDPQDFVNHLQTLGVRYFAGVPDSLLGAFCACMADQPSPSQHIIAANEGGAVALGIGHYMGSGEIPLVYMQNSGLGNAVNPILSLADSAIYGIPMVLLIGWRGEPGVIDEPQHVTQGAVTLQMLETMGIKTMVMDGSTPFDHLADVVATAREQRKPVALLVKKGTFSAYKGATKSTGSQLLTREKTIELILLAAWENTRFIATTGKASRELFELREARNQTHAFDFLTVGGMGHASQIAAGLANTRPDQQIICLDGDGAALMHMGSLAINASLSLGNFRHIVLNNAAHDSVGGQPTLGQKINFCEIAQSCGYRHSAHVKATSDECLRRALAQFMNSSGPAFLDVHIADGSRSDLGRPTIKPSQNKLDFMGAISETLCK